MIAQQIDGFADVVLRAEPKAEGEMVAKAPNGQSLTIIAGHGEYLEVQWEELRGPDTGAWGSPVPISIGILKSGRVCVEHQDEIHIRLIDWTRKTIVWFVVVPLP